jgi:hypothetical protein
MLRPVRSVHKNSSDKVGRYSVHQKIHNQDPEGIGNYYSLYKGDGTTIHAVQCTPTVPAETKRKILILF